jgi:methylenetetrahydrofolate dehydrogenase (NADP+)/methenyltetrahydrofolate cyclohydrolase
MALRIDGKAIAAQVKDEVRTQVDMLRARGKVPGLAVVLVGDDPASQTYVNSKEKTAQDLGMFSRQIHLPASTTQAELLAIVDSLNRDDQIHGILVQSPLPPHIDEQAVISAISPAKDVDGFHPINVGRLALGLPGLVACTPLGVMELLRRSGIDPAGKHAVVVGRSHIVGRPMAQLLLNAHATVTVCHSRTANLPGVTRQADILVAAVGKAGLITAEHVKPGAVVIDVGINAVPGGQNGKRKLVGDVDFAGVEPVAGHITPVPGGVGPMTIAMLMQNTVTAARAIWAAQE